MRSVGSEYRQKEEGIEELSWIQSNAEDLGQEEESTKETEKSGPVGRRTMRFRLPK